MVIEPHRAQHGELAVVLQALAHHARAHKHMFTCQYARMYVCMCVRMSVTICLPDFIYLLAGLVDVSVSRRQGCEKMANRKGVLAEGCAIGIVKELSGLHRAVVYFAD